MPYSYPSFEYAHPGYELIHHIVGTKGAFKPIFTLKCDQLVEFNLYLKPLRAIVLALYKPKPYFLSRIAALVLALFSPLLPLSAQSYNANRVDTLLKKANELSGSNYKQAVEYAQEALKLSSKEGDKARMAPSYFQLAKVQSKIRDGEAAEDNYRKALRLYRELDDSSKAASTIYQLGNLMRTLDRTDEASDYLFRARKKFEQQADSNSLGDALLSIGILYGFTKNYEKSEEYLLLAQDLYTKIDYKERQVLTLSNLGTLYNMTGRPAEALRMTERVKDFYAKNGPLERYALSLHNLGMQYGSLGEYDKSIEYNNQSREIYEELGDFYQVCGIQISMAKAYLKRRQPDEAEQLARKSLAIAEDLKSHNLKYNAYAMLYEVYRDRRDYKTALDYRLLYEDSRDSVFQSEKQAQINEMEVQYQTEIKERELRELGAQNELNLLMLKRKEVQQYILWISLILVLAISLLLFNQYRIKQKSNRLLKDKNEIIQQSLNDKEVLLKEIHHRVKNNLQFISSLLNLQSRHVDDPLTLKVLNDCKHRVNSMAMVHQRLYQEEDLKGVYMPVFVTNLTDSLHHSYRRDKRSINAELDIAPINLDIDTAVPIGLILNELITNVFKYAFEEDDSGKLNIVLKKEEDHLLMQVTDNGKGLPDGFTIDDQQSFGLQLVRSFAEKLGSELTVETNNGTSVSMNIRKYATS